MGPEKELPYPAGHDTAEDYVESLLQFSMSSEMLQTLCGGVHILDFLTRDLDLYSTVLPEEWRRCLGSVNTPDILDLLMREDLTPFLREYSEASLSVTDKSGLRSEWRGQLVPPLSLLHYIQDVRQHTLIRVFRKDATCVSNKNQPLSRQVAIGMKPKKAHEVEEFAAFIDGLVSDLTADGSHRVTHLVDFGSGQNYLGRVLASPPYGKQVIAIESKQSNINGAMSMDVSAKLVEKKKIHCNKKAYRLETRSTRGAGKRLSPKLDSKPNGFDCEHECEPDISATDSFLPPEGATKIQYIQHVIENGDLSNVVGEIKQRNGTSQNEPTDKSHADKISGKGLRSSPSELNLVVVSLHSCGNLVHHGIRSLVLNESVKAVAMVGCCYNLMTERLHTPLNKLPTLRPPNPRLVETSSISDPHGFPVSERLTAYKNGGVEGIRLNITARMMAVQAPHNWTPVDCEAFFTRHFYRALLQRILLDRGVVAKPAAANDVPGGSTRVWGGSGQPVVVGSLRKVCYTSFTAYVRGAISKLERHTVDGTIIGSKMHDLTDEEILEYERQYESKRKDLSIIWSLMAFSAGVVESLIVVDRWLYLKEQEEVEQCWVETVFDYKQSPRNLVVVGIKRKDGVGRPETHSQS
ncbi:MAG: hypothetical protein MMC33_009219 [Icmadophila ericetorum]|nr:hypothetical protein [Icmadophila ericetorum]